MPSGKAWSGTLPASTNQDTGATPAGKVRVASINLVNFGSSSATVNVYISTNSSPTDGDLLERKSLTIASGGVFIRTGEILGSGERIVLFANSNSIAGRVTYFEENA
ncbi:hypothetical protein [Nitrosomonas ureae]|uniref:Uncharacterized protein n=1 Tax=Nitrosomonas ureae TaxID=44577 RepID=A0A2T5ISJ7_9PROT|nr:hypothetical protein [Nitrosomonas ureae]PTQ86830.1 hypothetical protein C8R28_100825 [Nitrosomonas ureae]